jgi:alkaline phosphatase D
MLRGRRPVDRRRFLELVAGTGAVAVVAPLLGDGSAGRALAGIAGAADAAPVPPGYVVSFPDGIVAGDPLPTGTVIGTRVGAPGGGEAIDVLWEVGTDDTFATIAAGGVVTATAATGHTVKVVVDSLAPDRWYRYRFTVDGTSSVTGRLRTAPAPGASPDVCVATAASSARACTCVAGDRRADLDFFMHWRLHGVTTTARQPGRLPWGTFKDLLLQQCHAAVPLAAMWDTSS